LLIHQTRRGRTAKRDIGFGQKWNGKRLRPVERRGAAMGKFKVSGEAPPDQQRPIGNPSDGAQDPGRPPADGEDGMFFRNRHKAPQPSEKDGVIPEAAWRDRLIKRHGGQGR
jgi:hypothetical protein